MKWLYFSLKTNENWIDFEIEGRWSKTVIIKYNEEAVVTEKIGMSLSWQTFEFVIVEEDSDVHYSIEVKPMWRLVSFTVTRNGIPLLVTHKDRRKIQL